MLTTDLACAYTSLSEASFRMLARMLAVHPRECAGLAVTRWRRTDLDTMIDSLPARGAQMTPEQVLTANEDPAQAALKKAERRRRG